MKFLTAQFIISLIVGLAWTGGVGAQGTCQTSQGFYDPNCESVCDPLYQSCPGQSSEAAEKELQEILGETQSVQETRQPYEFKTIKQQAASLNPLNIAGPSDILSGAINLMMAFIGSVALLLYIYGGFLWMSAGGSADRVGKAKMILIWTTLGAVAMGASYMLVKTVLEKVG